MAVAATAHVDLPDTKSFLGITGSASDQILERCIDRASAWVDRYCGRVFKSQRHYEIKEGGGERIVDLAPHCLGRDALSRFVAVGHLRHVCGAGGSGDRYGGFLGHRWNQRPKSVFGALGGDGLPLKRRDARVHAARDGMATGRGARHHLRALR
jgi:hypothetical protein